jgi:hypothetical protein
MAAVVVALLFAKPFYSATTAKAPSSSADVSQPVADREPATEAVLIAASPTINANPQFFFGCGAGRNGYCAEQPELTLALVSYERMPQRGTENLERARVGDLNTVVVRWCSLIWHGYAFEAIYIVLASAGREARDGRRLEHPGQTVAPTPSRFSPWPVEERSLASIAPGAKWQCQRSNRLSHRTKGSLRRLRRRSSHLMIFAELSRCRVCCLSLPSSAKKGSRSGSTPGNWTSNASSSADIFRISETADVTARPALDS